MPQARAENQVCDAFFFAVVEKPAALRRARPESGWGKGRPHLDANQCTPALSNPSLTVYVLLPNRIHLASFGLVTTGNNKNRPQRTMALVRAPHANSAESPMAEILRLTLSRKSPGNQRVAPARGPRPETN